jgi:hypothetical protein
MRTLLTTSRMFLFLLFRYRLPWGTLEDFHFVILVSSNKSITSNTVGVDGISVQFFKLLLPLICCHVLHVFNHAMTSSVFPPLWNVAIIRPVDKVGNTLSGPSEFRPIRIVSVLSKAFERILHNQMLEHVNGRILLLDFQSGFKRGHSIGRRRLRGRSRYMFAETSPKLLTLLIMGCLFISSTHGMTFIRHRQLWGWFYGR